VFEYHWLVRFFSKIYFLWIRSLSALKIVDYLGFGINLTFFSFLKQDRKKSAPPSLEDRKHRAGGHAFSKAFLQLPAPAQSNHSLLIFVKKKVEKLCVLLQ